MATKKTPTPALAAGYQIRVRILDVYPIVWRRFLFRTDNTFADLHYAIQIAFNWSDDFLHQFKLRGKVINIPRLHRTSATDSAEITTLADFEFKPNQRFLYEYNFFDFWQIEVRIEKCLVVDTGKQHPRCIAGKRAAPPEDCGGATRFRQLREHFSPFYIEAQLLDFCRLLLDAEVMTEELRDEIEDRRFALGDLRYWINIDQFKRREVNRRLKQYVVGDEQWRWPVESGA